MSRVQTNINCPYCKSTNCWNDMDYKSGEEYVICPDCGYYHSITYQCDDNGDYVLKDKTKPAYADNLIPVVKLIDKPYGAYTVESTKGGATRGTIADYAEYQMFLSDIANARKEEDCQVKSVTLSRFVDGKIVVTNL